KAQKLTVTEAIPVEEVDNFFLVSLIDQWKRSDHKDAPALIQADRALAFAFEQNRLARDELLAQGQWALARDHLDAAARLFGAAKEIDPDDAEAQAGQRIVEKLRNGQLNRKQFENNANQPKQGMRIGRGKDGKLQFQRGDLLVLAQAV